MSFQRVSAPVFVWVQGPGELPDPDYGRPSWGGRPDNSLPGGGHIDNSLPWAPAHPGNKPPGAPIVPVHPGNKPPNGGAPPHPWIPGRWTPIDPGYGKPPLWGFVPVDPGWGIDEGTGIDNTLPTPPSTKPPAAPVRPDNALPGSGGGVWVPIDPDFGQPGCPGGRPKPPIWAWIPNPPDLSKPVPLPPEVAQPK